MYAWPVLFPAQTNREDFLRTVSLFDDDTGEAIDISGRTLAAPGDFTGNTWVVTSGTVVTASVTQLTIKDYPFGSEMQAIAATIGVGLNIAAGSPVTIADAAGRGSMSGYVTSYAPATGALVAQIGTAFEFEIRGPCNGDFYLDGYGPSNLIGSDDRAAPIITAQLGNGISVVDLGRLQIRIPASTIAKLGHKTYSAAMTMYDGADTRQAFVGKQPILSGGVSTMPLATSTTSNPYGLP